MFEEITTGEYKLIDVETGKTLSEEDVLIRCLDEVNIDTKEFYCEAIDDEPIVNTYGDKVELRFPALVFNGYEQVEFYKDNRAKLNWKVDGTNPKIWVDEPIGVEFCDNEGSKAIYAVVEDGVGVVDDE